jgi:hypothetical protein
VLDATFDVSPSRSRTLTRVERKPAAGNGAHRQLRDDRQRPRVVFTGNHHWCRVVVAGPRPEPPRPVSLYHVLAGRTVACAGPGTRVSEAIETMDNDTAVVALLSRRTRVHG